MLAPGEKLNLNRPRETLGVELSPLRETINRIVATGLVEMEPMRGYSVTPISVANLDEAAAFRIEPEPDALLRAMQNGVLDWESAVMGRCNGSTAR
ncbi:GntR family transcriptional regulator [Ponticoccus alexandrii]|uniref:GntR family transcriptional regulator n=1 Tax=Ponticoccus alexandrii TaxID=1943633 RepID=UPI0003D1B4C5|nr:GntR family transcriptional regulator [Ponticoccus alexandrii]